MQTEFVTSRQPAFQVVAGAGGFHAGQEVPHPACTGTSSLSDHASRLAEHPSCPPLGCPSSVSLDSFPRAASQHLPCHCPPSGISRLQVDDSYGTKSHAEFLTGCGFLPTTEVDEYSVDLLSLLQARPDFPEERLGALVRTGGSSVLEAMQKVSAAQA